MTIQYSLEEQDYLNFNLYLISKRKSVWQSGKIVQLILSGFYAAAGLFFLYLAFNTHSNRVEALIIALSASVGFLIAAVVLYFVFPRRYRKRLVNQADAFIKENKKNLPLTTTTLQFEGDYIFRKIPGMESKRPLSAVKKFTETPFTIAIRLDGGIDILIPKDKMENLNELTHYFKQLAATLNVNYVDENNWKWNNRLK